MSAYISLHRIRGLYISHGPTRDNANAISIRFDGRDGCEVSEVTIFDLPDHIADALAAGIRAASEAQPAPLAEEAKP